MSDEVESITEIDGRKYMDRVRELSCSAYRVKVPTKWTRCSGGIQAHHAGRRPGVGLKAADTTTIPFCALHHTEWHGATGVFKFWTKDMRFKWSDEQIEYTQSQILGVKS
jgi:hypothetical protein